MFPSPLHAMIQFRAMNFALQFLPGGFTIKARRRAMKSPTAAAHKKDLLTKRNVKLVSNI